MLFSKAIQIKHLVNRWNKERSNLGHGCIEFECTMFSLGEWSVTLKPVGAQLFFTHEMDNLVQLYAWRGFRMMIGATSSGPYIDMQ